MFKFPPSETDPGLGRKRPHGRSSFRIVCCVSGLFGTREDGTRDSISRVPPDIGTHDQALSTSHLPTHPHQHHAARIIPKKTHMYTRKWFKVMSRNVPNRNRPFNQGFPRSKDLPYLITFAGPRRNVLHTIGTRTEPCSTAPKSNKGLPGRVSCSGYVLVQDTLTLFELAHDQRGHRRIDGTFLVSEETIDESGLFQRRRRLQMTSLRRMRCVKHTTRFSTKKRTSMHQGGIIDILFDRLRIGQSRSSKISHGPSQKKRGLLSAERQHVVMQDQETLVGVDIAWGVHGRKPARTATFIGGGDSLDSIPSHLHGLCTR